MTDSAATRRHGVWECDGLDYDPTSSELIRNPFPLFARLRAHKPVYRSSALKGIVLTRHKDVKQVLGDFSNFSSRRIQPFAEHIGGLAEPARAVLDGLTKWVVFNDRPHHADLRLVMSKAFFPVIASIEPFVERTVRALFDGIDLHRTDAGNGRFDLVQELGIPLPTRVVAHLLGLPEADCGLLKHWSDELGMLVTGVRDANDRLARAQDGFVDMVNYFAQILKERNAAPGDDVISRIVLTARELQGRVSQADIIQNVIILAFAGHETTSDFISMATYHLLRNPGALKQLAAEPALIGNAVEELLRYDSPSAAVVRVATRDTEVAGFSVHQGERVFCFGNAANRDPEVFSDPECLDIQRPPHRSLTFGYGPHLCLGAPLARMEGRVVLRHLLDRLGSLQLVDDGDVWRPGYTERGLKKLELTWIPGK